MQNPDRILKQEIETWLAEVNYSELNSASYVPSLFALNFMNFIKLVNGESGEQNKTPPVHLKMLDKMVGGRRYIANLCFRGAAKTTLFMEYMTLYIAVFGNIPGFGKITGMIYVSDSMDNGVKSARKNIEFRYNNSPFLQEWLPFAKFTDNYLEFKNKEGHQLGVKMFGAKALALDTTLYLAKGGITTIGDCSVGDYILGADGLPTRITQKSEVFNKPMYELELDDGRTLKVSEDHLNQVWVKRFKSDKTFSTHTLEEKTLTTLELLEEPMFAVDPNGSRRPLLWVENVKSLQLPENNSLLVDPYTVGLLLGDGSMNTKGDDSTPVVITAHKDDWATYEKEIPYPLGKPYIDPRGNTIHRTVIGINRFIAAHGLSSHGNNKAIPEDYLFGSETQRLHLLQGLMDSDGTCTKDGKSSFSSNSKVLVEGVMWLARSLGGEARWVSTGKDNHFRAFVRINQPLFRLERKLARQKPPRNDKAAIVAIRPIAQEPSQCIAVDNAERQFAAGLGLVRTHNTGIRGTKIFGKRPTFCILDDLVSDEDAKSATSMATIKDTVYKGVFPALDPNHRKVVFNGTPFNKQDILIEAVESGAWDVNVWPVCERFPCTREEFVGAWEDRFSFDFVQEQYTVMQKTGRQSAFYQEYMLSITSEEDRLVTDEDIRWYSRDLLLANRHNFNFYITTDFATSAKQTADYTVISVWAYNAKGDWYWVDGIAARQKMDKTLDDLFNLVYEYNPLSVGIEITGQQGGFIPWLQSEMLIRNIWFTFASSEKSNAPGIRSAGDKLSRFQLVTPWFKAGKMFFPEEWRTKQVIGLFMSQLRLVTSQGIKGKDDTIDTISQLIYLKPWKPSSGGAPVQKETVRDPLGWGRQYEDPTTPLSSYIV